ncbi:MAG: DUF6596 domain-containing protein, partial [Pseudonocardiaceae bacterium]
GWLFRTARNRAVDLLRREDALRVKLPVLAQLDVATAPQAGDAELALRTDPLELPDSVTLESRVGSVLAVLYLLFNEGYDATTGDVAVRGELCGEAIRLARLLLGDRRTDMPRARALLALMLLQASRLPARVDARGEMLLLGEQDRSRWDRALIAEGTRTFAAACTGAQISAYHVEATIALCHAATDDGAETDWPQIVSLYDQLVALCDSPVIRLNRAIAVAMASTLAAGIAAWRIIRSSLPTLRCRPPWGRCGCGRASPAGRPSTTGERCACRPPNRSAGSCNAASPSASAAVVLSGEAGLWLRGEAGSVRVRTYGRIMSAAGSVISEEEIVDELRAAWAEVSRGYARCWAAMAEVARRTTDGWETAEIAATLTFTSRRADYELGCAQVLIDQLPQVHTALAAGDLDHHKARVFTDYLADLTPEQADRICQRLVPLAPGWTTGQLAARLLREVHAIDPDYTRRSYQQAVRQRAVHGYLDHTGAAVLSGSGLPAPEAAAAAARLEALADDLRAAGYPATVGQTRADLYLRLLDGTLDGLARPQILAAMLRLGPIAPADGDPDAEPSQQRDRGDRDHEPPQRQAPEQPEPAKQPAPAEQSTPAEQPPPTERPERPGQPGCAQQTTTVCPGETGTSPARYGIEVRVRLSTLLGIDDHPAELPGWGPIPAAAARDLVAAQHNAEWRIAIVDTEGYLLHGEVKRFSYTNL